MRILCLEMEAFGSFINKTVIDFTAFQNKDLFLVSGETGSGKTTIFDAIMFALYGTASGDERKSVMFRSQYADTDTKTYASLTFQYGDKRYRITRNPGGYPLKFKRGNGIKEKSDAEVEFVFLDEDRSPITKDKDANAEIQRILGVDRNQFKQIAMLAQGEFKKLLTEKTENKKEMFRKLFNTENYDLLTAELKKEFDSANNEFEESRRDILRERNNILVDEESKYYLDITHHKMMEDVGETEELISIAKQYVASEENLKDTKSKEESRQNKELSVKEAEIQENNRLIQTVNQRNAAKKYIEDHTEELKNRKAKWDQAIEASKDSTRYNQEIGKIENNLKNYEELSLLSSSLQSIEKYIRENKAQIEEKNASITNLQKDIPILEEQKNQKDQVTAEINQAKLDKATLSITVDKQKILRDKLNSYNSDLQRFNRIKDSCSSALAVFNEKKAFHNHLEDEYYACQAGILARDVLKENEPCPVCGSISHNHEHVRSLILSLNENISKEALDTAKKAREDAQKELDDLNTKRSNLEGKITQDEREILRSLSELNISQDSETLDRDSLAEVTKELNSAISRTGKEVSVLESSITSLERKKTMAEQAEKRLDTIRQNIDIAKEDIASLNTMLTKNEADRMNTEKRIKEIKDSLEYDSEKDARNRIEEVNREIKRLSDQETITKKAYDDLNKDLENKAGNITLWNKELAGKQIKAAEILSHDKERLETSIQTLRNEISSLSDRITANNRTIRTLRRYWAQYKEAEESVGPIRELYRTVNGEYGDKIKLETFIQSEYFERVLHRANQRMLQMSNGQFELQRREESTDKRKKEGMEIEVWDYNTNGARDIASLSGGESFMASLALALGLADEIQQSAGGIHFDSMFIDEGFGSLSENSLNKAINVLIELAASGCTIGIISHVSSLQDRIQKQILVTKDPIDGSSVSVKGL